MSRSDILKCALASISFANLLALPQWELLFSPEYAYRLYMDLPDPGLGAYEYTISLLMLMSLVVSFGGAIFMLLWKFHRTSKAFTKIFCFSVLLILLGWLANVIRYQTSLNAAWIHDHLIITVFILMVPLCIISYFASSFQRQQQFVRVVQTGLIITSPFIMITSFTATNRAIEAYQYHTLEYSIPGFLQKENQEVPKIVWIIFDELDIQLAFEKRSKEIALPALDSFKKEAIFADQALAAGHWTMVSVPSMLFGKNFVRVKPVSDSILQFTDFKGALTTSKDEKSIFQMLREKRVNAGIVGCFHPYVRLFGNHLASCNPAWNTGEGLVKRDFSYFHKLFQYTWQNLFDSFPGVRQLFSDEKVLLNDEVQRSASLYQQSHKAFLALIANPNIDFAFAHYLLPHPPAIYHKTETRFCLPGESDYSGNLVLVDKTLSDIRKAMMQQGIWDSSIVLIVSDHGLRPTSKECMSGYDRETLGSHFDERVPFLIKMPSQQSEIAYSHPINTTVIYSLIEGIVDKKVKNVEDVIGWFDAYPTKVPFSIIAEQNQITEGVFK